MHEQQLKQNCKSYDIIAFDIYSTKVSYIVSGLKKVIISLVGNYKTGTKNI